MRHLIIVSIFFIAACSTIDQKRSANPYGLTKGTAVVIVTRDAARHEFRVADFTDHSVTGNAMEIAYDDISSLEIVDKPKPPPITLEQGLVGILGILVLLLPVAILLI